MKNLLLTVMLLPASVAANAFVAEGDSVSTLNDQQIEEVVVQGVRVQKNAPFAVANIKKAELREFAQSGQELPFLLSKTPGVMAWGDNGVGTGTSFLRIRGAGDSRINVTIDGVPLNSPEDQQVFWANMNGYAHMLGSLQVQRGVGTSTNGDGAFGGTLSLGMKAPSEKATAELTGSIGSYNTYHYGASFSTGLLWGRLIFDGMYHETITDGFIHGTDGRSGSYLGRLTYKANRFVLSYKNFGNFEKTGQAWNGVTAGNDDKSIMDGTYGKHTGIHTYKDLYDAGLGQYNSLVDRLVFNPDGTFHTEPYTMSDGSIWRKTTDNFWQNHNILSLVWDMGEHWKTTASLHYTHGYGYYRELKPDTKPKKFGLSNVDLDGNKVERTDFVRRKGMKQDCYGLVWNTSYTDRRWNVIGGIAAQQFKSPHFGYITYISHPGLSKAVLANGDYQYYDSDARKNDASVFVKASFNITRGLQVFADVQYRHVDYKTTGINDKFYEDGGRWVNQPLNVNEHYNFLNPKAGLSYVEGPHRGYASVAVSHREPQRDNFTDNGNYPFPKAEKLVDYEAGYNFSGRTLRAGINLYYMDYRDQFVQTGQKSDIGEKLTTNVHKSYRAGMEITAGWDATPWLTFEGNAALSLNKIRDFDEFVEDWDDWKDNPDAAKYHCDGNGDELRQFHYDNSTLAFSPSCILNGFVTFHHKGFSATWHTNFVSRQYLDNTKNNDRSLPSYSVSNLKFGYITKVTKACGIKEVELGLSFNNILGRRYASFGWVYSAIAESYGHTNDNRYYQIGFTPSAGLTAMGSLTLRF
ncbi:MAG: TonB-dependent receptor plug domain-containing protein [Prevotella sp.]|nr:TonB-dependent receptor plug domain-containing protein [Prevotella sp.]